MRAVVYRGPNALVPEIVPEPALDAGDVLVEVSAAGVCGTDVRIVKGGHGAYADGEGRVPGHEIVGRIVRTVRGGLPEGLTVGDLVFVAPNIGCGECARCRAGNENLCQATQALGITLDGAFAERVRVPAAAVRGGNLIRLPDGTWPESAVLLEPLACVLRGQDKVAVHTGDVVLVCGGGPVGLLHVALARSRGAARVICSEPSAARREAAMRAGAQDVIDPTSTEVDSEVARRLPEGVDVVITAAPVPALQAAALRIAAPQGRVLLFGGLPTSSSVVELDTNLIHYKELLVAGTTASTLDDCRAAAALAAEGRIDLTWMVSDRFAIEDFSGAVARAQDPQALKVVVIPGIEPGTPGG